MADLAWPDLYFNLAPLIILHVFKNSEKWLYDIVICESGIDP